MNRSETTTNSRLAMGKHPNLHSRILKRLSNRQAPVVAGTEGQEGGRR